MAGVMITGKFTIGETLLSNTKKCSICGSGKELEPHHIINVNNYDELYNSPCNVIILCHTCHHNYHQEYNEINFHTLLEYKNRFDKKRISKHTNIIKYFLDKGINIFLYVLLSIPFKLYIILLIYLIETINK